MLKHQSAAAQPSAPPRRTVGVLHWLRRKFAPHNDNLGHWVSYVMIAGAMALFVIWQRELPPWRWGGTLAALSALLVINTPAWAEATGVCEDAPSPATVWLFFGLSAALVLGAFWLSGGGGPFTFLPYLLFMLSGQITATVRLRWAVGYSAGLVLLFVAIMGLLGAEPDQILGNIMTISMGMVFVMLFTIIAVRYGEQTARAEALLADLRQANAELAAARERERDLAVAEERVRLARDIHDGLGHHLTVLNVQLQAAAKLVRSDPGQAAATISVCRDVAQAALGEVRHSVAAMRSTPLDSTPLPDAIRSLVAQFDERSPVHARFVAEGTPVTLGPAAAQTLYRAAQEGLTNLQKHADAQQATVTLRFAHTGVTLAVENDGTDLNAPGNGGGFGLAGLRERAEQLGGTFQAGALPGGGFRLSLTLPLEHARISADT